MRDLINLIESLSSPYMINWSSKTSHGWLGTFSIGGQEYSIAFQKVAGYSHPDNGSETDDWYDLSFGLSNDWLSGKKVIGTNGQQFKIFSTVIMGIRQFIKTVSPEFVLLSASKENKNRFPLYQRMVRKFSQEMNDFGYIEISPPMHHFANVHAISDALAWRKIQFTTS